MSDRSTCQRESGRAQLRPQTVGEVLVASHGGLQDPPLRQILAQNAPWPCDVGAVREPPLHMLACTSRYASLDDHGGSVRKSVTVCLVPTGHYLTWVSTLRTLSETHVHPDTELRVQLPAKDVLIPLCRVYPGIHLEPV